MPDRRHPAARPRLTGGAGGIWPALRRAANAFCPPFEVAEERPRELAVVLRRAGAGDEIRLRYRSSRGLFLRSYNLVVEGSVAGDGPAQGGELVRRGRKLVWKRPRPADGTRWAARLATDEFRAVARRLQVEGLVVVWEPARARWRLSLETLSGGVTVTFFPPLETPNPLERKEAEAFQELLGALAAATGGTLPGR